MLFYYFKTKKDLYYYLINYGLDFIKKHYLDLIDSNESDFIKCLIDATKLKINAYTKHPELFHFLGIPLSMTITNCLLCDRIGIIREGEIIETGKCFYREIPKQYETMFCIMGNRS